MKCIVPFPAFEAGDTAIIYLYDVNLSLPSILDIQSTGTIILAQIHGHLQINERWVKLQDKLTTIIDEDEDKRSPIDHVQVLPTDPKLDRSITSSCCIFTTSKVPVSSQQLTDSGVFLEFNLPRDLLSSYKSRSMNVDYYVTIYVQDIALQKVYHFPFIVHSAGSSIAPYYTKSSSLAVYPVNSIPIDRVLSNELNLLSHKDTLANTSIRKSTPLPNVKSFNVRDKGHVCIAHLTASSFQVGKHERLIIDFSNNEQECLSIKASIVLYEKQMKDSSILQEKIVDSNAKITVDAEEIVLDLLIPDDHFYSFVSPIIFVEYKLVLDFYLRSSVIQEEEINSETPQNGMERGSNVEEDDTFLERNEPLSFSFPIEVNRFHSNLISSFNSSGRKKFSKSEVQNLCLQSRHSRIGIIELIETPSSV